MKFFKSTLATAAALCLLASPATAQYGREDEAAEEAARVAAKEGGGIKGYFQLAKSILIGGASPNLFLADPDAHIFNVTDANYKETIFDDEWIITL